MFKNWQSILGFSSLVLFCVSSIDSKAMPSAKASLIAHEIELKSPKRNPHQEEILLKQLQQNLSAPRSLGQINSVSQLRDVSPEDWAYEALRSLTERYGCIAGIEQATYRGDRAITRYEFAAGLNSCLQQIEQLIARSEAIAVEDLQTIQKLSQEFAAQLATIGTKLDNLENRTAFLEDKQFSTLTLALRAKIS